MKTLSKLAVGATLLAANSCSDPAGPTFQNVTLTANQATNLAAVAQTMSGVNAELAWLADSIEVILKAGTIAYSVPVTVDGSVKRYLAVSLMRQFILDSTSQSTLHFIAFDDATTPTDFILVNAWVEVPGNAPIGDFATALGAPNGFAHKVKINGATVTDYVGKAGTIDFSVVYGTTGCGTGPGFTCRHALLNTSFNITQARPDAAVTDVHSFSVDDLTIPGVWFLWNTP